MRSKYLRFFALVLATVMITTALEPATARAATLSEWLTGKQENNKVVAYDSELNQTKYSEVQKQYQEQGFKPGNGVIRLDANQAQGVLTSSYQGVDQAMLSEEDGEDICFSFQCESAGLYALRVRYCAMNDVTTPIVCSLTIDGEIPFSESGTISLYRMWQDDGKPVLNINGDEVAPGVVQVKDWQTTTLYDAEGYYTSPLEWYLSSGTHEMTLSSVENGMAVEYLEFYPLEKIPSYEELATEYEAKDYKKAAKPIYLEAENEIENKNWSTIRLVSDSDPTVSKTEAGKVLYNTVGGGYWTNANASITWGFDVEEDGLYNLAFHLKQNFGNGLPSYRRIEVDGKVPFKEFENRKFLYGSKWRKEIMADEDGDPYEIYLKKGHHTLTMTVTLGELADMVEDINRDSLVLSDLILQITMLVGQNADTNYDYRLEERIPDLIPTLKELVKHMDQYMEILEEVCGKTPSLHGQIKNSKVQIQELIDNPFDIAAKKDVLDTVVSTMGTAITSLSGQGLLLDNIQFVSSEKDIRTQKGGFWARLWGGVVNFFQSFTKDYDAVGNAGMGDTKVTEVLDVWVSYGEDWGALIQEMADSDFTPKTGIGVKIHVVPAGQLSSGSANALLLAISSGTAPDVTLGADVNSIGEFALRNAVVDLTQFEDYEEVIKRYQEKRMIPLTSGDAVYGLPEVQNFQVMIYRKDILSDLGLTLPETWEDLYNYVLPVLYQNNMEFYCPLNLDPFIYQNGATYYNEDMTMSALSSEKAFLGFQEFVELYSVQGVPIAASFFNRFRSGEMPIGIGDLSMYMQIRAAAPELKGRWGVALIPGHEREDGTVNHSMGNCVSQAAMILNQSDKQEAGWEFLKWWTSDDVQTRYGNEIEALKGEVARWSSANKNAFAAMAWPKEDYEVITEALSQVDATKVVLGGYFNGRHVLNAFNRVCISHTMNERDSIEKAVEDINKELARKRETSRR